MSLGETGKRETRIVWFARGGNIQQCGPFDSQVKAVNAMRRIVENEEDYQRAVDNGATRERFKGGFPDNVFVWPEEVSI